MASSVSTPNKKKAPFLLHSRQKVSIVDVKPYVPNQRVSFQLPDVGFISRCYIEFEGAIVRNAAILANTVETSPWNLIKRATFKLNQGAAEVWDTTGWEMRVFNRIRHKSGFDMGNANDPSQYDFNPGDAIVPQNNRVHFVTEMQIAANNGSNYDQGLINLQAEQLRADVVLDFGALADIVNGVGAATLTGTITLHYEYYEVPSFEVSMWPANDILHRTIGEETTIDKIGENKYKLALEGSLLRLAQFVRLNSLLNTQAVDKFSLRLNKSDTIYEMVRGVYRRRMEDRYSAGPLSAGLYLFDLWDANDVPGSGPVRDIINTSQIASTEAILTIGVAGGALGPTGTNTIRNVREFLQMLSQASAK